VRPRTTYSGKLRNPNPKMPDFRPLPFSRIEYERKNVPPAPDHGHGHDGHGAPGPSSQKEKKKGSAQGAKSALATAGGIS
jgi:molybdopterin-containing oxidoreductase family iron-sulfur binding subunit